MLICVDVLVLLSISMNWLDCVWVEKYWTAAAAATTVTTATSVLSLINAYPSPYIDCTQFMCHHMTHICSLWTASLNGNERTFYSVSHSIGFPLKRAAAFCGKMWMPQRWRYINIEKGKAQTQCSAASRHNLPKCNGNAMRMEWEKQRMWFAAAVATAFSCQLEVEWTHFHPCTSIRHSSTSFHLFRIVWFEMSSHVREDARTCK